MRTELEKAALNVATLQLLLLSSSHSLICYTCLCTLTHVSVGREREVQEQELS